MELKKENLEFAELLIEEMGKILVEKQPMLESFLYNTAKVRQHLMKESDRGCVILAVSYLESILSDLLKGKLIGSKKHFKDLFDFNGPLGSFSGKIKMAYSIGVITEQEKTDINNIRALRNIFAHSHHSITLEDKAPKAIVDKLKLDLRIRENDTPRRKFISVTWYIISMLGINSDLEKFKYNRTEEPIILSEQKEKYETFTGLLNKKL